MNEIIIMEIQKELRDGKGYKIISCDPQSAWRLKAQIPECDGIYLTHEGNVLFTGGKLYGNARTMLLNEHHCTEIAEEAIGQKKANDDSKKGDKEARVIAVLIFNHCDGEAEPEPGTDPKTESDPSNVPGQEPEADPDTKADDSDDPTYVLQCDDHHLSIKQANEIGKILFGNLPANKTVSITITKGKARFCVVDADPDFDNQ